MGRRLEIIYLMKAYKLFRLKKSGEITSLFINKTKSYSLNEWYRAFTFPTEGFVCRGGFHCVPRKYAPHLSKKNRIWAEVEIKNVEILKKPKSQGGKWYLAKWMKIKKLLT